MTRNSPVGRRTLGLAAAAVLAVGCAVTGLAGTAAADPIRPGMDGTCDRHIGDNDCFHFWQSYDSPDDCRRGLWRLNGPFGDGVCVSSGRSGKTDAFVYRPDPNCATGVPLKECPGGASELLPG